MSLVPPASPNTRKPAAAIRNLGQAFFTTEDMQRAQGYGSELLRRLMSFSGQLAMKPEQLKQRFNQYLELYTALLERFDKICRDAAIECHVVLLPGKSLANDPDSLSGVLQKAMAEQIIARRQLKLISFEQPAGLFYPKDGHLTAAGHEKVADILSGWLNE